MHHFLLEASLLKNLDFLVAVLLLQGLRLAGFFFNFSLLFFFLRTCYRELVAHPDADGLPVSAPREGLWR